MIILRFGHGIIVKVPEAECWCVCHGLDGANRVIISGHWHACPTAHRCNTYRPEDYGCRSDQTSVSTVDDNDPELGNTVNVLL